jgi:hypothetical protein
MSGKDPLDVTIEVPRSLVICKKLNCPVHVAAGVREMNADG